jgi:hypothetical protein
MTERRLDVLAVLAVVAIALGVRIWTAAQIPFPRPEDTAYYVGVARNLLEGRGLVSDALWSFGTPPLEVPRAAFEVWLPLPTFLAAIPMAILGSTFAAAQVSSVLLGSVIPVLSWWLARDVAIERGLPDGRRRVVALGAGLTAAVYLPLVLHAALPDSTTPFAVLALLSLILMARLLGRPAAAALDARLIGLGILLGLTAWTRNELLWLAGTWVLLVLVAPEMDGRSRLRHIGVAAVVSLLIFTPWMARNWAAFGSPLPGQAASNALSLTGRDIFAWNDPPTLARYLDAGVGTLIGLRVTGVLHNLSNVLLFLGVPISAIGIAGLVGIWRSRALRPLLVFSALTFLATSLLFPVSTTWGTFLHASGPVQVLLVVSAMFALDAAIAWVGRRRGWTRPVAWLGPVLGVASCLLFSLVLIPTYGASSTGTARLYAELGPRLAAAGHPLEAGRSGPVISNFPIWVAETQRVPSLALPDEPPPDVLDLASTFPGTRLVVVTGDEHSHWPHDLDAGAPGSECFQEVDLGSAPIPGGPDHDRDPLEDTRVFEIVCPASTGSAR